MAAPQTTPNTPTAEMNRAEIARRYCAGETQVEIAAALGVRQQAVSYHIGVLRTEWRKSRADYDAAMDMQLAKIDEAERRYWRAWEESRGEVVKTAVKRGPDGNEITRITQHSPGNPAFLNGVLTCVERRCKLLGLDAPNRTELTGPGGVPLKVSLAVIDSILAESEASL